MRFKIFNDNNELVNTIIGEKEFIASYCIENGYTFEEDIISDGTSHSQLDAIKLDKHTEISEACNIAIVSGVDVALSDGETYHFSLTENDQINLNQAYSAVTQQGMTQYPYHADGCLCKVYSVEDIITIGNAATKHKLYHTTYCNHVFSWIDRSETIDEINSIRYGVELPDDLAQNMTDILNSF